jgi:hypothetical protein
MSDFSTVLVEDSVISELTDEVSFGVISGAAQKTFQPYTANSVSDSTLTFSIQIPSESICINRHLLIETDINLTLTAGNVPVGLSAWNPKLCSFNAYPFHQLVNSVTNTINNTSVTTQTCDILPAVLRMNDPRAMGLTNSFAPSLRQGAYASLADAYCASNSAGSGYRAGALDNRFMGDSSIVYKYVKIEHYDDQGDFTDDSLISLSTSDTWKIYLTITTREPLGLCLSPWVATKPDEKGGIYGVNNMSFIFQLDSTASRVYKAPYLNATATPSIGTKAVSAGESNFITSVSLGNKLGTSAATAATASQSGLLSSRLLFEFNTFSPEQATKLSGRCVNKFLDYPRYISQYGQTTPINSAIIQSGSTFSFDPTANTLTSQSIQLNQVPDYLVVYVRVPLSKQSYRDELDGTSLKTVGSDGFLSIKKCSITFNNGAGIMSTALQPQLYDVSRRNGLNMTFEEFQGFANDYQAEFSAVATEGQGSVAVSGAVPVISYINPQVVPSGGSMLIFSPAMDFNVPEFISSSSLGQFNMYISMDVYNQYPGTVQPEIVIIAINSGVHVTSAGQCQVMTGLLTKQQVLDTKSSKAVPAISTGEFERLVGGAHEHRGMSHIKSLLGLRKRVGAGMSGGGVSGGASSGGVLSRHIR